MNEIVIKFDEFALKFENDRFLNPVELIDHCRGKQGKDVYFKLEQESHCLRTMGVYDILDNYDFKSVNIWTFNAIERHERYRIETGFWSMWFSYMAQHPIEITKWTGDKLFSCFFGRPSAARLGLISHLMSHKERCFMRLLFQNDTEDARLRWELTKLFSWDVEAAKNILQNLKQIETSTDNAYSPQTGLYDFYNPIHKLYNDTLIDIVSEATLLGDSFYPTEKVARVIRHKRPFIAMTNKNYLAYLKQIGFRTFYEFWDESYDVFEGKERYFKILELINNLLKLSGSELDSMYSGMTEILEHNHNLLMSDSYKKQVEKIYA